MFCMITGVECARVVVPGLPLAPCPLTADARQLVVEQGYCQFQCEEDWQEGDSMASGVVELPNEKMQAFMSAPL